MIDERRKNPDWPLTFLIDGSSGHFDVSAELVTYLAQYIDAVVKARLPRGGQTGLHPVDLGTGYLADLAVPGHTPKAPTPYSSVAAGERALPWYLNRQSAMDAQTFAAIDWQAKSPLIGFTDAAGDVLPFDFNGITNLRPTMEADGITFHLRPILLDKLPDNFLHAGDPVAKPTATPTLEWMCGATTPIGGDALRVSMDRSYRQQANYYVARIPASPGIRAMVQPVGIKLEPNHEGSKQQIEFTKPKDVKAGTKSISLEAHSDSGLPVRFFVVAGPATIDGNRVVLTAIPPRTKFPVEVTVAAWQWGRTVEPKIQTAPTVRQTFVIKQ